MEDDWLEAAYEDRFIAEDDTDFELAPEEDE